MNFNKLNHYIGLVIRAFNTGSLTEKEATDYIMDAFKRSSVFHGQSFYAGFIIGVSICFITLILTT